ncbi:glutaredoxin family protein [Priestia taiwanensis]|uniref:Thioredoxin family protein n=1 Tax=Priestia taiwanensis TaxID=1347902 RepID=A0A917AW91_9BACI|nr:glutaredoxin family protein [Priestia taiwanensis]MBM7364434.1 glutaredoxin [Priestia taiwanensis]GGE81494.1 thioredoxin family protein [Priestia taiwanensis]
MVKLKMYSKDKCCLCEDAKKVLHKLQEEMTFEIEEIDIYTDDVLLEKYQIMIPVIEVSEEVLAYGIIKEEHLRQKIVKYF